MNLCFVCWILVRIAASSSGGIGGNSSPSSIIFEDVAAPSNPGKLKGNDEHVPFRENRRTREVSAVAFELDRFGNEDLRVAFGETKQRTLIHYSIDDSVKNCSEKEWAISYIV